MSSSDDPIEVGDLSFLVSYFGISKSDRFTRELEEVRDRGHYVMLDSGAFSAWTQGKPVSLDGYIEYLLENGDRWDQTVALDVIGDFDATIDNWEIMKSAGLDPAPVWGYGAPVEHLDEFVQSGAELICLGGMAKRSHSERMHMSQFAMNRHPDQRFHGLGIGDRRVSQLPWASVDSISPISCMMFPGRWPVWDPTRQWPMHLPNSKIMNSERLRPFLAHHDFKEDYSWSDGRLMAMADAWGRAGKVLRRRGCKLICGSSSHDLIVLANAIENVRPFHPHERNDK